MSGFSRVGPEIFPQLNLNMKILKSPYKKNRRPSGGIYQENLPQFQTKTKRGKKRDEQTEIVSKSSRAMSCVLLLLMMNLCTLVFIFKFT